ncbi:MAG: dephospho-CoA kinase [Alphaproteobacteria bacterium]|nr:dephospho-CoA kinase [Alphaproteobacteria bacterium]
MMIVGLTGSIGMGKTMAAVQLRRLGIRVYDADAGVHALMSDGGGAMAAIADAFPDAVSGGAVDRTALGEIVYADAAALRRLESIVHPLVRQGEAAFLRRAAIDRVAMVVLDIPLLFETGGDRRVDATMVVSAPAFLQAQRVLRRPGMTHERLERIRRQQMPDAEKRRRADFVIHTGLGKDQSLRELKAAVSVLARRKGRHWPPGH